MGYVLPFRKTKKEHIKWYTMMMVMLSIVINSIVMCRPVQSRRVVAMTWPYQFSSVQNGIHALGKAHTIMHSTPSLRGSPNVAFETVPVFVSLTMVVCRPFKKDRLALPFCTPLSSRHQWCDVLGFMPARNVSSFSTLQIFREASHL